MIGTPWASATMAAYESAREVINARPGWPYGRHLIYGQLSYNGTATLAKRRLQHIVAQDREKVPAYRWVFALAFWRLAGDGWIWQDKPRYRWERRR